MDGIMAVSEAFRSVERILGILGSAAFMKTGLENGVGDELITLKKSLFDIEKVLEDAGEQQSSNPSVRIWLHSLIDVACDIEDILDRISTLVEDWELKMVGDKLDKVADDMEQFGFKQSSGSGKVALYDCCNKRVTHSCVVESEVFGREQDIKWVINRLFHWKDITHPRVLAISGRRGVGKTTLLQLVMNDAIVAQTFEVRIWAYISKEFTLETAVLSILQSATGENYSGMDMGALQTKLHELLVGKTYLIVLDSVWFRNSTQWLELKDLLAVGRRRSTIIATTDDADVASLIGTMSPYELKELSDRDSWAMFKRFAFNEGEVKPHPRLVVTGLSIAMKCEGVPLAVKTLGSLLRNERDHTYWQRVEKSELWEIDENRRILPALAVSFCHTPHLLKLCLASCAIFEKKYPLYRSDLISLWMGHGFLQCGDGSAEDAWDLGDRCFDELISRSFFQLPYYTIRNKHAMIHMGYEDAISQGFRTCDGKVICVEMHDLLHDLATYVAREETAVVGRRTDNVSIMKRHLVWDREQHLAEDFAMDLLQAKKARTFVFLYPMGNISKLFMDTLFSNFRCLRILIFSCCALKELPESIGDLKLLRYLNLRGNSQLELLPESVCNLVNLIVLDLGECERLTALPENVHRLISLRTLTLTFRSRYLEERALGGWNSLQVLKLTLCPNLVSLSEEFGSLKSLRVLIIRECHRLADLPDSISGLANLERITLESCRYLDLTGWEGLRDLVSLQFLAIDNLSRLWEIPDMGKAARTLQYLKVSNCKSFSSFPDSLQNCTSLLKLQVFSCPSLTSLPSGIQCLSTLQELRISGCPELSRKCERDIGDYWRRIAHVPEVYIDEKVIQSHDVPTKQAQAGTAHDWDDKLESLIACHKDKVIQSLYELQAGLAHDLATMSSSDSTLKSGLARGNSLANQTERQSPISPDEVTQLPPPTHTEIVPVWREYQHTLHDVTADEHLLPTASVDVENQGTNDDNDDINKEEAKGLLFLFDEGYEFEKQMMIQLWMALGILVEEPMEENGESYFENLVSEGYILCSVPNYLFRVSLEKLGNEVNIEKKSCIKLDNATRKSDSSAETLHASVVCDEINASVFHTLRGFNKLRTLLFLGSYGSRLQQVPRDLFLCYESLEALDLSGTHIKELPSSIGKMINLRYLDLSWTLLEALPERVDRFKKLQTLKLEGCSRLRMLPIEIIGLTDLRHLHLDVLKQLAALPEGMGGLVNIRTLSAFPVGIGKGLEISELKYLNYITGSFCIAKIENVQGADVAKEAFLSNKKNIKKLKLRWSNHKIQHSVAEAESILENLFPSSDVEEIQIICYPGIQLPDWIADVSYDKLVSISLFGCVKVNMLPSMGKLPSLKSLELISFNSLIELDFKGVEVDYVAFPKLQKLSVKGMLNLETWAEAGLGDYPCIEELSIQDCPELRQFPSVVYVPILKRLEVSDCISLALVSDERLSMSLEQLIVEDCPLMEDRCSKDEGQDWHKIQHVPIIWVDQVAIQ